MFYFSPRREALPPRTPRPRLLPRSPRPPISTKLLLVLVENVKSYFNYKKYVIINILYFACLTWCHSFHQSWFKKVLNFQNISEDKMGRMHAPGKGISQSALPYRRTVPQWMKLTSDEVQDQIFKLAKKGLTPSQIGVILRDSFGVAQVRKIFIPAWLHKWLISAGLETVLSHTEKSFIASY